MRTNVFFFFFFRVALPHVFERLDNLTVHNSARSAAGWPLIVVQLVQGTKCFDDDVVFTQQASSAGFPRRVEGIQNYHKGNNL
jgi:hypothetical protein